MNNVPATCALLFGASLAVAALPVGAASPLTEPATAAAIRYQLVDDAWASLPQGTATGLRLDRSIGLAPRHEIRLSTAATLDGASLLAEQLTYRLDAVRATYRYTLLQSNDWAWKLGLTTYVREFGENLHQALVQSERVRFGGMPMVHLEGSARLGTRWLLTVDADGLYTSRGRAFDLGLRVNYTLNPSLSVYGGYRLVDTAGEADELYQSGLGSSANVGLRLRF